MQARRLDPIFRRHFHRDAREIGREEEEEKEEENVPKREGLEEIRLPPAPCVSVVSRVLSSFPPQNRLSSCFPVTRSLPALFLLLSGGSDISLVSRPFIYTPCVGSTARKHEESVRRVAPRRAPVENHRAMKRTSRPTLYRY